MNRQSRKALQCAVALAILGAAGVLEAAVFVQCPGDKDGDAACSKDGAAILECKSGKFSEAQKCEKGKCKAEGLFVKCE